jgi:Flp pilus assembly protein TadB
MRVDLALGSPLFCVYPTENVNRTQKAQETEVMHTEKAQEQRRRRNREGAGTEKAQEQRRRRNREGAGTEKEQEQRRSRNREGAGTEKEQQCDAARTPSVHSRHLYSSGPLLFFALVLPTLGFPTVWM